LTNPRKENVMQRSLLRTLASCVAALGLLAATASSATAAPEVIRDTCSTSGGKYSTTVKYRDTGGAGSGYYPWVFGTNGPPIDSVRFVWMQGQRTSGGTVYMTAGIMEKTGIKGNTAYTVGPEWTGYAGPVWITRNPSVDGDTDEKVSIMSVYFNINGEERGCQMVTRQP
jgi:hypothetical protein